MSFLESMVIIIGIAGVLRLSQWRRERKSARFAADTQQMQNPCPDPLTDAPPISSAPDMPQPFGYKAAWLAVGCDDPKRLMDLLDFSNSPIPANWSTGLAAVDAGKKTFVSPCMDGWVILIRRDDSIRELIKPLAEVFPEVQYFSTHRVTESHAWAKYSNGHLIRKYCYIGEQGKVLQDTGMLTPEELALGFEQFPKLGAAWTEETRLPDEEDVLAIAAAWGVDTSFGNQSYAPAVGWVCGSPMPT